MDLRGSTTAGSIFGLVATYTKSLIIDIALLVEAPAPCRMLAAMPNPELTWL